MAAPAGNQNAAKAKQWSAAIERALDKRGAMDRKVALDALAEKLLGKCDEGDMAALKELGDRLDGKAAQAVTVAGDSENPLVTSISVEYVKAAGGLPVPPTAAS
jgi:hypothetical protein